jgi:transcriptional regulator with XRE-family HTH domain
MTYNLHNMQIQVKGRFACHALATICMTCTSGRVQNHLRALRDRLGLTLEQMTERAPYSVSQLSRWESGESNVPSGNLPVLAAAYECRVQDIFTDDGPPPLLLPNAETLTAVLRDVQQELPVGLPYSAWPESAASALRMRLEQLAGVPATSTNPDRRIPSAPAKGARPRSPTKRAVPA